jgi:hypothetical protein
MATLSLGNTALLVRGFLSKLGFFADFLYVWVQLVPLRVTESARSAHRRLGRSKLSCTVNDIG